MVIDPDDSPCSSYYYNALGQPNDLLLPHPEYPEPVEPNEARQAAYCGLFKQCHSEISITEIREATHKA